MEHLKSLEDDLTYNNELSTEQERKEYCIIFIIPYLSAYSVNLSTNILFRPIKFAESKRNATAYT
jgi:hypothetical protein